LVTRILVGKRLVGIKIYGVLKTRPEGRFCLTDRAVRNDTVTRMRIKGNDKERKDEKDEEEEGRLLAQQSRTGYHGSLFPA
jgi:hypothetical protein